MCSMKSESRPWSFVQGVMWLAVRVQSCWSFPWQRYLSPYLTPLSMRLVLRHQKEMPRMKLGPQLDLPQWNRRKETLQMTRALQLDLLARRHRTGTIHMRRKQQADSKKWQRPVRQA